MKEYDAVSGVPMFSYYLEETIQFGDFEVEEKVKITHIGTKEELIELCQKNNWHCNKAGTAWSGGWATHHIKYRSL